MKGRQRATGAGSTARADKDMIAQALRGPLRIVYSHCPACLDELPAGLDGCMPGAWVWPEGHQRTIVYRLCRHCSRTMEKGGLRQQKRLAHRIERNLEEMGATAGIERAEVRA